MQPGDLLKDRYTIVRAIKSGGMGAIYLAEDNNLGKSLCAVKQMLDQEGEMNDYARNRFEAEMLALVKLQHPGIPRVRDYFQEDNRAYMVMDFIAGPSLEEEMEVHRQRGKFFTPEQAVSDMITVLEVLSYMHDQVPPVLHRDIKPANLIREQETGQIKVVDFGLARSVETSSEEPNTTVGTLGYSALEQLTGRPEPRSDLYSAAMTLHEMITGHRPTLAGLPEKDEAIPDDLDSILRKAAAMEPQNRYASTRELRQALQAWLKSRGVKVEVEEFDPHKTVEVEAMPRPPKPTSRRPWQALVITSLIALLVSLFLPVGPWSLGSGSGGDPGFVGDIFSSRADGDSYLVSLGEDVGLFWIHDPKKADKRSATVAVRLNKLYHHQCGECKKYLLEPEGIRVGRYEAKGVNEVVLFYAHMHGDKYAYGPELLATIDRGLADRLKTSPRYLAGYWRNLMRDVVALSRGQESGQSPLGPSFQSVMEELHKKPDKPSLAQLRALLVKLPNEQAQALQQAFETLPAGFQYEPDLFPPSGPYKPLKS